MNVSEDTLKGQGFTPVNEALPKPFMNCVVITPQARLLAFLDCDHTWRDARNLEIKNVQAWQTLFPTRPR